MPTIAEQLTALDKQRDQLAANLVAKGVSASSDEKFNTLVPKVLEIPTSGSSDVDTSDATAEPNTMLAGYTAYAQGIKIVGNIPSKDEETFIPNLEDQEISSGQYLSGNQTIKGDANLLPENIKAGISIFGVVGDSNVVDTTWDDANTVSSHNCQAGMVAFINGIQVTGEVPDLEVNEVTPTTEDQILATEEDKRFINKGLTIKGDSNLVPMNIREGVTLFGVKGSYSGPTIEPSKSTLYDGSNYSEYGSTVYVQNPTDKVIYGLTVFITLHADFCSPNYANSLNYSANLFGWDAEIFTCSTTPVTLTESSQIAVKHISGSTETGVLRLVQSESGTAEDILSKAQTEGSYIEIPHTWVYATDYVNILASCAGISTGEYYLVWSGRSNNSHPLVQSVVIY